MQEQEKFRESLAALMEIAKAKDNTLTMDEIKEVFQDILLEEEKFETIYAYLSANKVKVQNYIGKELNIFSEETESKKEKKSEKEDTYVKMYLEDISAIETCQKEEMEELCEKIKQGNKEAEKRLIEGNLQTVVMIAKEYQGRGILVGDLIQEGNMGLMTAVSFMKEKEDSVEIKEFIRMHIQKAIEEALGEQNYENQWENEVVIKINRLSEAAKHLEEELGRHPEVKETAEFMNITEEEVKRIMSLSKDVVANHHCTKHSSDKI